MPFKAYTEEIYRTLWEHALIGVALVAKDGTFITANPAFCMLTEYTEAELRTKSYQDITHPDDVSFDQIMAEELVVGRINGYDMPKRYLTKFGRVINIMSRVAVIRDPAVENGKLVCFLSQMAPLAEHQIQLNSVQKTMDNARRKAMWKAIFGNWPAVVFAMGLAVSIIVQVIERIN